MRMEPVCHYETLANTYQTTRCNQTDNAASLATVKISDFLNVLPRALLIWVCDSYTLWQRRFSFTANKILIQVEIRAWKWNGESLRRLSWYISDRYSSFRLRKIMRPLVEWCWQEKPKCSEKKTCPSVILSNTWRICCGHTDNRTGFSPSSSVFYCQNHSTNALHSFSYNVPYILANKSVDM